MVPEILVVYGTRPEAIKLAPVIAQLRRTPTLASYVVSTGQHKEMLQQVTRRFGIHNDADLKIMTPDQGLTDILASASVGIRDVIAARRPVAMVVQGDTTTAMAAALAGFHRQVPVVHLEAGLRTGNLASPFPEEANRQIISRIAALHLAPTARAKENLLAEAIPAERIVVTGNTVIDALHTAAQWDVTIKNPQVRDALESGKRIILVTAHRRENVTAMEAIAEAVVRLTERHPEVVVILPAHPNPQVRQALLPPLADRDGVVVTDPLDYDEFIAVMRAATVVLTDSGGVQEEAPSLNVPVLVLRDTTERREALDAGTIALVGIDAASIVAGVERLLGDPAALDAMRSAHNPYGDGQAAARCVAALTELVGCGSRLPDFQPE